MTTYDGMAKTCKK